MSDFFVGHATHPEWRAALALAAAQIDDQREGSDTVAPTLGFAYVTDHYAGAAAELLAELRRRWPGVPWVGTVGVGVAATGVEHFDEPALVLMLSTLATEQFEVFSGHRKLQRLTAGSALVHADPRTQDLGELVAELSDRTRNGYLFGGLSSSRGEAFQFADGVLHGGLSGVAFAPEVAMLSRVTQGCQPVGPARRITACARNLVTELDGEPALACLLRDTGISLDEPQRAMQTLRGTLVGLSQPRESLLARGGQFGSDTRVRHLIGLDPAQQGVAIADVVEPGMQLAFCQRDVQAARRDLVRICAEIRDELVPEPVPAMAGHAMEDTAPADPTALIAGAVYVSCAGRGGPHFGSPSAELRIVQHALGDVPLVGFFAGGEIGHRHLYGYTGVLTVFTRGA